MFVLMKVSPLTPPSWSDFTESFFNGLSKFLDFIFAFFVNIVTVLSNFYDVLTELNGYVVELGDSAQSSITGGLPLLELIGAYRYLIGDPVFYMTYILVIAGCLFTIFKLAMLLHQAFAKMKESIASNSKTSAGIISSLAKFFT
ncbi:MAG: hypothetical protein PHV18_14150 [Lachnospiraceae bacterium]|nr:hypothetical protein [Lachnospiraceae bacterium]